MLNKQSILDCKDLPKEKVEVPEWGGFVYVKTLTGSERDFFEDHYSQHKNENIRATLACLTVCDEEGKNLFDLADVHAVGGKSASALDRIFHVALKLNGISKSDVDELEKN